jgi:hypothetical protein
VAAVVGFDVVTPHAEEHLAGPDSTHLDLALGQWRWTLAIEGPKAFEKRSRELALVEKHLTPAQL